MFFVFVVSLVLFIGEKEEARVGKEAKTEGECQAVQGMVVSAEDESIYHIMREQQGGHPPARAAGHGCEASFLLEQR